ncbi:MAG TPA: TlpA disulfide reductase family protein [Candidatus Sulfotelmatobacter sp.]|nr:TlpA disulfide reductase family protein [Candidatus Sulfotelmatobacter sp.]
MAALEAGKTAPEISLQGTNGQAISLAEALKKGPVVAAFFKVNCPVCQFTFPFLERMYESYGDSKVTFLGISQNDPGETRAFNKEYGVKFPVLIDEAGYPASNQYGLTNVPTVFLISPGCKIQESSVGFAKADLERIAAEAARASGKPSVPLFKPGEVIPDYKPG